MRSDSIPPKHAVHVLIEGNPLGNPDSFYRPSTVRILPGQTVTWVDRDDSNHTVAPDLNYPGWSGGSGILSQGQRYSFKFTKPGVYRYHCMVHQNMLGIVIVRRKK